MTPVRPRLTRYIGVIVILVIVLVTTHGSISGPGEYFPRINPFSTSKCPDDLACLPKARYVSPRELLSRPFPLGEPCNASIPKIIHQSWSSKELPARFQRWSDTWRTNHPDWEWVLWTNEDNSALVEQYFPWFRETYQQLGGEIFRADAARNMYMYAFGGYAPVKNQDNLRIYVDLDTECLRPFDRMLSSQIATQVSTLQESASPSESPLTPLYQHAFFGRMGPDPNHEHSIPNAWMASTPRHPFFMLPLEGIAQNLYSGYNHFVEGLTGPVALRYQIWMYESHYNYGRDLIPYLRTTVMNKTYFETYDLRHSVTVLPPEMIYPFSWVSVWDGVVPYCLGGGTSFTERDLCKEELRVWENGAYCITYWTHTWTPEGHDEGHVESMQQVKQ
jgi:inositol phosphorylceramide mannosyltransferase catalytic subunit